MRVENEFVDLGICGNLVDLGREIRLGCFGVNFYDSLVRVWLWNLFDGGYLLGVWETRALFEAVDVWAEEGVNHYLVLLFGLVGGFDVVLKRFICSLWVFLCFRTWSSLHYSRRTPHLHKINGRMQTRIRPLWILWRFPHPLQLRRNRILYQPMIHTLRSPLFLLPLVFIPILQRLKPFLSHKNFIILLHVQTIVMVDGGWKIFVGFSGRRPLGLKRSRFLGDFWVSCNGSGVVLGFGLLSTGNAAFRSSGVRFSNSDGVLEVDLLGIEIEGLGRVVRGWLLSVDAYRFLSGRDGIKGDVFWFFGVLGCRGRL